MKTILPENLQLNRHQRLDKIARQTDWDLIIIGGGITGAGILKLASQIGLKALLLEQKDFAWGSSSRSSKMVHGGLRYIPEGQVRLTLESVRERQRLLKDAQGLVTRQSFAVSHYAGKFPWPWIFNLLLSIYDLFAGKKQHQYWRGNEYQYLAPGINTKKLKGGSQFSDAMTDDARLVLRLLQEAQQLGAQAINYVKVTQLLKDKGRVIGVVATANENGKSADPIQLTGKIIVNATGAWANDLFDQNDQSTTLRPLRGSHLVVPSWRLPVATAISVQHPQDKRPVQIFPWQNVTVIGTTDVEHRQSLDFEPRISQQEIDYLLACVDHQFSSAKLTRKDVISTFAGVRPVVASGNLIAPSSEKRDHSIWQQPGLVSISGGKLTTFRVIAQQVIQSINQQLEINQLKLDLPVFEHCDEVDNPELTIHIRRQVTACYGQLADEFISHSDKRLLSPIAYSANLWAQLEWAIKYEQVVHLDDLLLRRTRIGNVLPDGAKGEIKQIKKLCLKHLKWDENRWQQEVKRYQKIWQDYYSCPQV